MKKLVAVGTKDGAYLNGDHFGQSKTFVIFEVDGDRFTKVEERENPYFGRHQHAKVSEVLTVLGDCKVWIGSSMGAGSMKKLKEMNYEPFLVEEGSVKEAVKAYLESKKD
ncbi:dinitrogenase iron-molybdenum cofactor biosynthesis protein [Kosmotoga arenicorallina S304]|uniref:Dinitrogenase iron-molybdenum cofactor biosynthesis protein n=1 Tax=Kosmotoga arenicorallina S304 TaxID=1453497 RepID=A0A176JZ96_9BACT|nr:NifB/NifX family molybdenum-iron cluster-binding protein [Kosmotoga arenicorallina]OAA29361.1 dinitrogenase iron-molybdenum cofactor biosynthesis protein [Kosmotoga arenicorallina S304]